MILPEERFQRLDRLFNAALELPAAERGDFLVRECPDDAELRAEVAGMLQVLDEEDADRELAGVVAGGLLLEDDGPEEPAFRFGSYRILSELGRGGLGTVYLAERDDSEFSRRVALKLVRRGMESDEIRERLRLERQILAKLDHPNIARLYDGGTTDDGMPYFVMEVIDGERLDRWCASREATLEQRLVLMQKICDAVHYAHRNLVLHRDLKPSNILVNTEGEPKLLDFGIAKVLEPESEGAHSTLLVDSPALTRTGNMLLTPEFASPEQVRAEPLTTASDVYALGVVLYHLVTGQRPYDFDRRRASEIERVVCTVAPERASLAAQRDPRRAAPGWPPAGGDDLDNIIAMALRKEPERRYGSAAELAEDLRRYREDLPVQARPDTLHYRTSKFIRRHRVTVSAAGLVLIALVVAVVVTSWQARVARAEKAKSDEVVEFLLGVFEVSDPSEALGETITAREILDRSVDRIRRDPLGNPEHRATFLATMGRVYRNLALYESADELLDEAVTLWRQVRGRPDDELARALVDRGQLELIRLNFAASRALLAEALEVRPSSWAAGETWVAEALALDAQAAAGLEQFEESEALFEEAVREAVRAEDPVARAMALDGMGEMWLDRKEIARAEAIFRTSLDLRLQHLGDQHPDIAESWNELGRIFLSRGHAAEAEPYLRQALEAYLKFMGEDHDYVAVVYHNLASSLRDQGRPIEAQKLYQQSLELRTSVHGEDHLKVAEVHDSMARNQQMLASQASKQGDMESRRRHSESAREHARLALDIKSKVLDADDSRVLRSRGVLADQLRNSETEEALGHYVEIVRAHRQKDPMTVDMAQALVDLGRARGLLDEPVKAENSYREALEIYETLGVGADVWYLGQAQAFLGILLAEQKRHDEARPLIRAAASSYGSRYPSSPLSQRVLSWQTELEGIGSEPAGSERAGSESGEPEP